MSDEQVVDGATPEQVETPEAATGEEQQTPETPAEGEVQQEENPAEPKPKKGIERRFSELTARAKAAEQYAQRLEQMLDRVQQPQPPQQPTAPQGKPTREQFEYDEDRYLEALTDWKLQERLERAQQDHQERQRQAEAQRRQMEFSDRVQKANQAGMTKFEDYEDVVLNNADLVITPVMADAMTLTEVGPEIAVHLGKNTQEARRIAGLPPQVQIMEIARLEAKIKAPIPKTTTKAPEPVTPVGGNEPAQKNPENMSTREWIEAREREIAARRK